MKRAALNNTVREINISSRYLKVFEVSETTQKWGTEANVWAGIKECVTV